MGIPVVCEGTIAELDQDHRGLPTALWHALTSEKSFLARANHGVDQAYRYLNDHLAGRCANAPPPQPPPTLLGVALTGHNDAGRPLQLRPRCWRFSLLDLLSSRSRFCGLRRRSGPLACRM
jgi:hypothetical protein